MMRTFLLSLFLILPFTVTIAQDKAPAMQWQKTLGGTGNDFGSSAIFANGAYYICGTTYSANIDVFVNHGDADIWIVKLNTEGGIVWEKTYGSGLADNGARIIPAKDGGFIVGGTTWPQYVPPTDTNSLQWWIFKIDENGSVVWDKKYGGSSPDNLTWIDADAQGNIYCAGHSASNNREFPSNKGNYDIWVFKLSPAGDKIWSRAFGGSDNDRATQIHTTKDGGCVVVGFSASNDGDMTENHGGSDGFAAKISANNSVEWKHLYGTPAAEAINAVDTTYANGYLVAGITQGSGEPNGDFDVLSLSADGVVVWQKQYGGGGRDEATAILCRGASGFQVIGTSESTIPSVPGRKKLKDFLVYRIDTSGNQPDGLFTRMFGGDGDEQCGGSLLSLVPPGFLAVGRTNSKDANIPDSHGNFDVWVIKYGGGAAGLLLSDPFIDFGSVDTGSTGNHSVTLTNVAGEILEIKDILIRGNDSAQFSVQNIVPFTLGLKGDTTITVSYAPHEIGAHNGLILLSSTVGAGSTITVHGQGTATGGGVDDIATDISLVVAPNPVRDKISVTVANPSKNMSIVIDNAIGENVRRFFPIESSSQYSLGELPAGMYMLSVYANNQIISRKKFVKE